MYYVETRPIFKVYFIVYSVYINTAYLIWIEETIAATLRWFTAGVQSASLYDNFRKRGNYVIMTS